MLHIFTSYSHFHFRAILVKNAFSPTQSNSFYLYARCTSRCRHAARKITKNDDRSISAPIDNYFDEPTDIDGQSRAPHEKRPGRLPCYRICMYPYRPHSQVFKRCFLITPQNDDAR
jgi:hypothetical protein